MNPSAPLIRYVIEDVTDKPLQVPDHGFAILHNVSGRNDDMILNSNGDHIHAAQIDALFEDGSVPIRRYRVHQESDGSLTVSIELSDPSRDCQFSSLTERLHEIVGDYPIRFEAVDSVALTDGGKHRVVTSDLSRSAGLAETASAREH